MLDPKKLASFLAEAAESVPPPAAAAAAAADDDGDSIGS
jgi:hypothetical protein